MQKMAFEALAYFHDFEASDFPQEWLPLTWLYDPDIPLFPILYFHELDPALPADQRPGERDRLFGFVHHISYNRSRGTLTISCAINKDVSLPTNSRYIRIVEHAARARLGLDDPVTIADISDALTGELIPANQILMELWQKIVVSSFGGKLPYGKCWDPVFGLARYIASWNSEGGRKGELIQLHAYASSFGERVSTSEGIHADFYLLPTWSEFHDLTNPLSIFPDYAMLVGRNGAAEFFIDNFITSTDLGRYQYSAFNLSLAREKTNGTFRKLDTAALVSIMDYASKDNTVRTALYNNYSVFNRGPGRSVLSLLMHYDLRHLGWNPENLTQEDCIEQYTGLAGSYQSPKVMELYAQQCFGSLPVLPVDNWVKTFLATPLNLAAGQKTFHARIFNSCSGWGKIERLIWISAQARKVHASVAEDILWCIRYGGPNKEMRAANPFSCKVCLNHIRAVCPSYDAIKDLPVLLNPEKNPDNGFAVETSAKNNTTVNQTFVACERTSTCHDEYTPKDRPAKFKGYPVSGNPVDETLTVSKFLEVY